MSSVLTHCVLLVMRRLENQEKDTGTNQRVLNGTKGKNMEDHLGNVHLKMMRLEGSNQTELVAVKSALKRSSECFRDVTGAERRFVIGVRKLNDKNHPAHTNIEMDLELVQLLRWIVDDEFALLRSLTSSLKSICVSIVI